jgi:catechol 2,3-dioxygenase-like lactoylglutathione lyase family enzyme
MHLMVPNRYEAARWYRENLGFEIVEKYELWAKWPGGPLHISADGGKSGLALFEPGEHPPFRVETSVAFRVAAEAFIEFARGLGAAKIREEDGQALTPASVVDHDLCYAYYFRDPYGNRFELDCYEYDEVRKGLIEPDGITPVRFG